MDKCEAPAPTLLVAARPIIVNIAKVKAALKAALLKSENLEVRNVEFSDWHRQRWRAVCKVEAGVGTETRTSLLHFHDTRARAPETLKHEYGNRQIACRNFIFLDDLSTLTNTTTTESNIFLWRILGILEAGVLGLRRQLPSNSAIK